MPSDTFAYDPLAYGMYIAGHSDGITRGIGRRHHARATKRGVPEETPSCDVPYSNSPTTSPRIAPNA